MNARPSTLVRLGLRLRFRLGALVVVAVGAAAALAPATATAAPTRSAPHAAHILHAKVGHVAPSLALAASLAGEVDPRVPGFGGETLGIADVRFFEVTSDKTGTAVDFIGPGGHYAVFAPHDEGAAPTLGRARASTDAVDPAGAARVDAALLRTAPVPMQRALGYDVAALRSLDKSEARALAAAVEHYVEANRANTAGVPLYRWVWPDTEREYRKLAAALTTFARSAD